jgi:hypothetical protein
MGASTWVSYTPYHPKPSVALGRLREEVFSSGLYRKPATIREAFARVRMLPSPAETHRATAQSMRAAAEAARRNPAAHECPELREQVVYSFRALGMTPPPGTPLEQLIAYYEALAAHSDRMTSAAEVAHPELMRRLDTIEAASMETESPPGSIAELLDRAGSNGTHSVLDIRKVGKRPAFGTAVPLRTELLHREFGTEQPTRSQVESAELAFAEALNWQAVYFAVYEDGRPAEWAFVGSTGD